MGRISFANAYPIYRDFLNGSRPDVPIRLVAGAPASLNRQLERASLDLAPVSSAAFARNATRWRILPGLAVAARGSVRSVLLLERRGGGPGTVRVPPESETACAMVRLLSPLRGEGRLTLVGGPLPPRRGRFLAIGDRALGWRTKRPRGTRIVYDVAEEWRRRTRSPAVFAVFAVRNQIWRRRRREVLAVVAFLRRSVRRALTDAPSAAREAARGTGLSRVALLDYFRRLRYELKAPERRGLAKFLAMGAAAGLWPRVRAVRFVEANR